MPISHVVETISPDRDAFDVVIVGDASQASIGALFLLWLAPRVIVLGDLGDEEQRAPPEASHGTLDTIVGEIHSRLPEAPVYLRNELTAGSSLYRVLATRFPGIIRLRGSTP